MQAPRRNWQILAVALILVLGIAAWIVMSLRDDDSTLSVVVRQAKTGLGIKFHAFWCPQKNGEG
jgi:hypothetical protein